ncbi:hypothetical protein HPP92_004057 [Vanilla planifolia]|uniref:Uncharacterized protein n=1 Tax=Vanilla planifolia TaxID=51239 RepID=A0A835SBJ9_VANPL|nr:hypothetical protein HPP92_004057 [Vanilla planifolia]
MQTLHSRRPDSSVGNHFSFSRPNSEHLEYDVWAETIKKTQNPFGRDGTDRKIGPWVRRNTAPNSSSNFGTSSPPLWRSTTQESLPNFSRTQLIAKYRQEMMDLVRGLDEPAYELSLRDMVESPARMRPEDEVALTEKNASSRWMEKKDVKRKGRETTLRSSSRSESTGKGGFY